MRKRGYRSIRPARLGSSRYCAMTVLAATLTAPLGSPARAANSASSSSTDSPIRRQ